MALRAVVVASNLVEGGGGALHGGGIASDGSSLELIDGCLVEQNEVRVGDPADRGCGGGISASSGALLVVDSVVSDNLISVQPSSSPFASQLGDGGGLWTSNSSVQLRATSVQDNTVSADGAAQSGRFRGGGIWAQSSSQLLRDGIVIDGNLLPLEGGEAFGAGIGLLGGSLRAQDAVINGNVAEASAVAVGSGIALNTSGASGVRLGLNRVAVTRNRLFAAPVGEAQTSEAPGSGVWASAVEFSSGGGFAPHALEVRMLNTTIAQNESSASQAGSTVSISGGQPASFIDMGNVTVAENVAAVGDLISFGAGTNGLAVVTNSLFAQNSPSTCAGTGVTTAYNLFDHAGCFVGATDVTQTAPLLSPLGDHDGVGHTYALDPSSPAADAADPMGCTDHQGGVLAVDQRGAPRDAACDIGAYEWSAP